MRDLLLRLSIAGAIVGLVASAAAAEPLRVPLDSGWSIQSSANVKSHGDAISRPGFAAAGGQAAPGPGNVGGALGENGRYPDPYTRKNLRPMPGATYPIRSPFAP